MCVVGLRGSLSRLQLDYVDIVFANRSDINAPMEGQTHAHIANNDHLNLAALQRSSKSSLVLDRLILLCDISKIKLSKLQALTQWNKLAGVCFCSFH